MKFGVVHVLFYFGSQTNLMIYSFFFQGESKEAPAEPKDEL